MTADLGKPLAKYRDRLCNKSVYSNKQSLFNKMKNQIQIKQARSKQKIQTQLKVKQPEKGMVGKE